MPARNSTGSVRLADSFSASAVLYAVLADVVEHYPQELATAGFPADPAIFRKRYPDLLTRFEAVRLASTRRTEIATRMVDQLRQYILWEDDRGPRPLHEALAEDVPALQCEVHDFGDNPGWQPMFVYRGQRWEVERLSELGELLVERGVMTSSAREALNWITKEVLSDGVLDLSGRKIAVLGGGAEMAPTRLWLEAGADVLYLDTTPPPTSWWESSGMSGQLHWCKEGADLLTQPREVLSTLIEFAQGKPLDIGLYAYAPGRARELLLTASMNSIVNVLPVDLISSVTMLVSPTTPTEVTEEDLQAMQKRIDEQPLWEKLLAILGLLGKGTGNISVNGGTATRTVVDIQGASYQAAQYLGKILAAEYWSTIGQVGSSDPKPLRVSANTAAITRTRSLEHPVFAAAFGGAAALGVETLTPRQSRRINGLLAVRDWVYPEMPTPGSIRVHGGIHTLPHSLQSALMIAAAIGFARSPRLLGGLLGRS